MMEGEIYDYKDLKKELILKGHKFLVNNDPEFILHLYEEYKENFGEKLKGLNGIFLFAIYDTRAHKLIICNDRYGFKLLYCCDRGDYLLFASEIKAILQDKSFTRSVDLEAMTEFFSFGYVLGDKTLVEGVKLLPPASIFNYSNGKMEIKQYWNWNRIKKIGISDEDEILNELGRLWLQAVERRVHGDVRIGLSLSGGLDSRAIASAISHKHYPIHAVTFGRKGCDDYKIAKKVCEKLGIEHHFVEITAEKWFSHIEKTVWLADGQLSVVHQHSWDAVDIMKEYIDIHLPGLGAAFIGGIYLTREIMSTKELDQYIDIIFRLMNCGQIEIEGEENFYNQKVLSSVKGLSKRMVVKNVREVISDPQYSDYFFINNKNRRWSLMGLVCSQIKLDNRLPFFDNNFVEFVYSLPNELRFNHYIYNKMLLKFFPETFKHIPWQKTGLPIVSHKITQKVHHYYIGSKSKLNRLLQKIGLPPLFKDNRNYVEYDNWMRNNRELREYIYDSVLSERALNRGYFNPDFIRNLIDEHMCGKKNNVQIIGLLLTFELFNRMFIDR